MKSLAPFFAQIKNNDNVIINSDYFQIKKESVAFLLNSYYSFINHLLSANSILEWTFDGEKLLNIHDYKDYFTIEDGSFLSVKGFIKSNIIDNDATMQSYIRKNKNNSLYYNALGMLNISANVSYDYPEYYENRIKPYLNDEKLFKDALIELFSIDGRNDLRPLAGLDFNGFISVTEDEMTSTYYGSMQFIAKCVCFDYDEICGFTNEFCGFLEKVSLQICNINSSIQIGTIAQAEGLYLGELNNPEESSILLDNELIDIGEYAFRKYFKNVGWANYISPAASKLIKASHEFISDHDLIIKDLENKALVIKSKQSILDTTCETLKKIKLYMYNVVFPSCYEVDINYPYFRSHWERVPYLDEEITVESNNVVFRSLNLLNLDYVFPYYRSLYVIYNGFVNSGLLNIQTKKINLYYKAMRRFLHDYLISDGCLEYINNGVLQELRYSFSKKEIQKATDSIPGLVKKIVDDLNKIKTP